MRYLLLTVLVAGSAACSVGGIQEGMGPAAPLRPALQELAQDPGRFADRYVIVTGMVDDRAYRNDGGRWGFDLMGDGDAVVRCYERHFRQGGPFPVTHLLRRAGHEAGLVEVAGWAHGDGRLELDWIDYAGMRVDTDVLPRPFSPGFSLHF